MNAQALPRPGPRWGNYPQRPVGISPATGLGQNWSQVPTGWPARWQLRWHRRWLAEVRTRTEQWRSTPPDDALAQVRLTLRRQGFTRASLVDGVALVSLSIERALGRRLHDTQLLAAALMLDQRAVEMATGEGKTLAMACGAAVAALAGTPVHVVTANDYLAQRDAEELTPLWSALGLQVSHIEPGFEPAQRRARHTADIVYATAKELAFDHLRDCLAQPGSGHEQPVLRGLCLALLDEADSVLLDEAVVPLIISAARQESAAHKAQRRATWWQAWQLSATLQAERHFAREAHGNGIRLTAEGQSELAARCTSLPGLWRRARLREELVQMALVARHALHKDQHYLLREDQGPSGPTGSPPSAPRIELLDTLTGRVAHGRVWSQGLQALVELKEACPPGPTMDTLGQLTFQRFFQRYWRMGALSGTLIEARRELQRTYGLRTVPLPTRLPLQRRLWPTQVFDDAEARWQAVVARAAACRAEGRPVLIGTDTVADSERLSWHLHQAGLPHQVLNARHDAGEAAIVAQAGEAGCITVSTRMAGRGTDIQPDARALAAGGLHIINCQCNESPRMDRQLLGRCARQGQPGSAETWLFLATRRPTVLALAGHRLHQWLQAMRQAALRQQLLAQDEQWETQRRAARRGSASEGPA